jgi:hypothetical protein
MENLKRASAEVLDAVAEVRRAEVQICGLLVDGTEEPQGPESDNKPQRNVGRTASRSAGRRGGRRRTEPAPVRDCTARPSEPVGLCHSPALPPPAPSSAGGSVFSFASFASDPQTSRHTCSITGSVRR